MEQFKFLVHRKQKREYGFFKLKDAHNRYANLMCVMSEYPDSPNDDEIKLYQGNILGFFMYINLLRDPNGTRKLPTIYEMQLQYRGVTDRIFVYKNHFMLKNFIARKFYITVKYSI